MRTTVILLGNGKQRPTRPENLEELLKADISMGQRIMTMCP